MSVQQSRLSFQPYVARRMLSPMAGNLNDSALMLRFGEGDVAAFERLYERHKGPLYRYCLRHSGNPEVAADLFQEVWSKLIKSRSRYRPTARFTTYLYRIAHNCCVDYFRHQSRQPTAKSQNGADLEEIPGPSTSSPERQTENELLTISLRVALSRLPPEQREAFLLREESGLSVEEIATVTGVGFETAKSRLRYAVRKLREALVVESQELTGTET